MAAVLRSLKKLLHENGVISSMDEIARPVPEMLDESRGDA